MLAIGKYNIEHVNTIVSTYHLLPNNFARIRCVHSIPREVDSKLARLGSLRIPTPEIFQQNINLQGFELRNTDGQSGLQHRLLLPLSGLDTVSSKRKKQRIIVSLEITSTEVY